MEYASHEVDVHTGAAIVFENCIRHRFRQIRNLSMYNQRRTFLNFFIVDPQYSIQLDSSEMCLCYYDQLWNLFNELSFKLFNTDIEQEQQRLPHFARKKILSFLPNLWLNLEQAKQFRQRARKEMLAEKSGWGWIQFGNSGIVQFIISKQTTAK
jgi:hypothetical protein